METIKTDLNTSLQFRINVGAASEQIKDISECHWCDQFSLLITTNFIKYTNLFRAINFYYVMCNAYVYLKM